MHCVKIIRSAREKVTHFLPLDYKMHRKQETWDQPEECAIVYLIYLIYLIYLYQHRVEYVGVVIEMDNAL